MDFSAQASLKLPKSKFKDTSKKVVIACKLIWKNCSQTAFTTLLPLPTQCTFYYNFYSRSIRFEVVVVGGMVSICSKPTFDISEEQ